MCTHINSYNSNELPSFQIFECKVLDQGSMKEIRAFVSVTATGTNGVTRCCTSLDQALDGSTSRTHLMSFDRHYPVLPYQILSKYVQVVTEMEAVGVRTNHLFTKNFV
jgi:hypothetical protein